jgi:CubicO group peptidase (beta-lactamase class C family)
MHAWGRVVMAGLALAGCAGPARTPGPAVDELLGRLHAEGHFQGAVVLARDGRIVYERAFGAADVAAGAPFTLDTPCDAASIAKTFTAAAIMLLATEGRLDLEAPVQRYVPAFPHAATRVRHLVTHAAGLPDYDWMDAAFGAGAYRTNGMQVEALRSRAATPSFPPGSRFAYDNVAYDVAALVVEAASGQSYEAFLRARFFAPLGMAAFVRPASLAAHPGTRARGYRTRGGERSLHDAFEGEGFHGAANVYLSARDLNRWAAAFAAARALPPEALRPGMEFARIDSGARTRLALLNWYASPDRKRAYYTGDHQGFYSFAYWDTASRVSVAFVSNGGLPQSLKPQLARALVEAAEGRSLPPVAFRQGEVVAGTELAGEWRVGASTVALDGDKGFSLEGVRYRMVQVAPGVHYVPGTDATLVVRREPDGLRFTWLSVFDGPMDARRTKPQDGVQARP